MADLSPDQRGDGHLNIRTAIIADAVQTEATKNISRENLFFPVLKRL